MPKPDELEYLKDEKRELYFIDFFASMLYLRLLELRSKCHHEC